MELRGIVNGSMKEEGSPRYGDVYGNIVTSSMTVLESFESVSKEWSCGVLSMSLGRKKEVQDTMMCTTISLHHL